MRKHPTKKDRMHISKDLSHVGNWHAYLEHSAPLLYDKDLSLVSQVAIDWAKAHDVEKVIVHHTASNAEVIYSV